MGNNVYSILCPGMNPRGLIPLIINPNAPRPRGKRRHGFNNMAPMGSTVDDAYMNYNSDDDTDADSDSFGSNSDLTGQGVKLWNHSSIIRDNDNNIPVVNQNGLSGLPSIDMEKVRTEESKDFFEKVNIRVNPFDEIRIEEDNSFKDPGGDSGICDQTETDLDITEGNLLKGTGNFVAKNNDTNNISLSCHDNSDEIMSPLAENIVFEKCLFDAKSNDFSVNTGTESEINEKSFSTNSCDTTSSGVLFEKCNSDGNSREPPTDIACKIPEESLATEKSVTTLVNVSECNFTESPVRQGNSLLEINEPLTSTFTEKMPSNLDLSKKRVSFQDIPESITLPNDANLLSDGLRSPRPKKKKVPTATLR